MKSRTLQISNVREQDGWGITLSLILHGLLLLAVIIYQQFFTSTRQVFNPNYQTVSLLGAAPATKVPAPAPQPQPAPKPVQPQPTPEPVQPKAEPIQSEPKPAATPIAPKPPAEPKPKPTAKPDSSQELNQRLRDLQQQQDQRRAREAREAQQQRQTVDDAIRRLEQQQQQQSLAAVGAAGRAGSSTSEMDPRLQLYNQRLHDLIYHNWIVPQGLDTKELVVVINFNIRRDGRAERIWIEQSSGNVMFDQSGLRAAEKANPFPALPSAVRSPLYEVGIIFRADEISQ